MVVQAKVIKWGNSLGIRLQKAIAEQMRLANGTTVDIKVSGSKMVVTKSPPKYTLKGLMKGVNEDNIHGEIDSGSPMGTEIW